MSDMKRLVLDVMKPHEPTMLEITERVSDLDSVGGVNASLYEVDEKVVNIKMTVVGESINFKEVESAVEDMGGSVHSVDEVVSGELVEESKTPQDYSS